MALASTGQEDFGAGIHRGREAPANAVYDCVDGLISDEGQIYRRGGTAYYSGSNAGSVLSHLDALHYPGLAAPRVTAFGGTTFYALNGTTPVAISSAIPQLGRPASIGGIAVFPIGIGKFAYYAGSLKTATYNTGSVATTAGSPIVTGTGTSWLANVDPGMMLRHNGSERIRVVRSVDSDTQVTLTSPWPTTNAATPSFFRFHHIIDSSITFTGFDFPNIGSATYVTAAGSGLARLLVAMANRIYLSALGDAFTFDAFDPDLYHELPSGAEIISIEGVGETVLVFTTAGVWAIDNVSLDPVDAFGNQQQSVRQISGEVVCWGDLGITPWAGGGVIVPATDDVYLVGPNGVAASITGDPENERVRRLYRSYTATDAYQPGRTTVYRGHLFLPIIEGTTVVDTLVCRLDRGMAWTRLSGHASGLAHAVRPGSTSEARKLLGLAGQRVTDLTGCFDPTGSNATDADGTAHVAEIITRDYPTGSQQHGFVQRLRARYELADGGTPDPAVAVAFSSDQDAGVFTTLTERGEQGGGAGWVASDGSKYSWALVAKRRERVRFRFRVTGAAASFVLRGIELLLRPTGKQ